MKIRKTSFPFFYCYWYKNQTSVRLNQIKTYSRFSLLWLFFFLPWLLAIGYWKFYQYSTVRVVTVLYP